MKSTTVAWIALLVVVLGAPRAMALITYTTEAGWLIPGLGGEGSIAREGQTPPQTSASGDFSFGGALCPATGTSDYFCANVFAEATLTNEGVALRASARESRHDATRLGVSYLAHGDASVTMCALSGSIATPANIVKFHIGLGGTSSHSASNAGILTQAFGTAYFNGIPIQCLGSFCNPVVVSNFVPGSCNTLRLRADAAFANQQSLTGWDAEADADFADTLKLLAIEPLDANEQPIPGLQYSLTDGQGTALFTYPVTTSSTTTLSVDTTSTTSTATTLPAGGTTSTTLADGCGVPTYASVRCRLERLLDVVAASDAGPLASRLTARVQKARAAIDRAEKVLGKRQGQASRAALGKALKQLTAYERTLASKKARKLSDATRSTLAAPLADLRAAVRTLPTAP